MNNAEKILELLKSDSYNGRNARYGIYDENKFSEFGIPKLIEFVGGEGCGDHCHAVIHFEKDNVYYKMDGYYSSYEGFDWSDSDWVQVNPVEKTITVYE